MHPGFAFVGLRVQVKGLGILDGRLVHSLTSSRFSPLGSNMPNHRNSAPKALRGSLIQCDRPVALTATVATQLSDAPSTRARAAGHRTR